MFQYLRRRLAGYRLVPLSADKALEALYEAEKLKAGGAAGRPSEEADALIANACLAARGIFRWGKRRFPSGAALLSALTPPEINALAAELVQGKLSPLTVTEAEADALQRSLRNRPEERIRWRITRTLGWTEKRAMTGADILWCALHMRIDEEERRERLCPTCRERGGDFCPSCGAPAPAPEATNPSFDETLYTKRKNGGADA
ncbi:hypothetical protein LJC32_04940 [Oscillospiraceae bacterium OttesenSCG-928-F05]|nr:hypothetical protein [Oscillospiraceae bacterium OttesenSCG-928-F05]